MSSSTNSEELIHSDNIKRMQPPNLFYRGASMKGTFKPGDKLSINKILFNQTKKGDVIIFNGSRKNEDDFVAHRVIDTESDGLVTRGDNNSYRDRSPVTEEDIIGKVVRYERNGKIHKVWSGRLGMLWAWALYGRTQAIRVIKFFLRKPYLMIRKTGLVAKLWRPEIEIIYFETNDGPLIKYVHNDRTVAIYWTDKNRWWYRRPYDILIKAKQRK